MNISLRTNFVLQIATITPDTCTAITHGATAETTTHPVEDGSSIADHVIRKPLTVSFTTSWTPRPIDDTYLPQGNDRGLEAFQMLTGELQLRRPIQIVTDGQIYDNMVLQSVTMPRAFEDGDGRTINIECQQIQIVSGQTVKIKVAQAIKSKSKKKKVNKTKQYWVGPQAYAGLIHGEYIFASDHDW